MRFGRLLALAGMGIGIGSTAHAAAWQRADSKHFVVYSNDDPAKVQALTTRLEQYDKVMRELHAIDDPAISPNTRVTIFVMPSVSAVGRLAKIANAAGFYIPRASGSVAFVPREADDSGPESLNPQAVLFHEYAHHIMYSSSAAGVVPPWLSEGFAEFHATTQFRSDGQVVVGRPPLYRAFGIARGSDMPIQTLLSATPTKLDDERIQMLYGRGWLLTHYLTVEPSRRPLLNAYLAALNAGKPAAEAAKLLGDPRTLGRSLDAYVLASRLPVFSVAGSRLTIGQVSVRALNASEAAMMPALILSQRGVDSRTSHDVATQARKAAAPYPTDAAAQNELAEAEFDAGEPAAALAAAERALTADPRSIHAMMYTGLARIALASKTSPRDLAAFDKARGWFSRANHADPENPWPLEQYYLSFQAAGQKPTHNAEEGLLYARVLAPFDPGLGLTAAYVYLTRDKADDAARVLKPIAYNPHGGATATFAQTILTTLEKDGAAAAAAAIRANPSGEKGAEATHATLPRRPA